MPPQPAGELQPNDERRRSDEPQASHQPTLQPAQPWLSDAEVDRLRATSRAPASVPSIVERMLTPSTTTPRPVPPAAPRSGTLTEAVVPPGSGQTPSLLPPDFLPAGPLRDKVTRYVMVARVALPVCMLAITALMAIPALLNGGHWTSSSRTTPAARSITEAQDRFLAAAADFDNEASTQLAAAAQNHQPAPCAPHSVDASAQELLRARYGAVAATDLVAVVTDVRDALLACGPRDAATDQLAADLERVEAAWAAQMRAAGHGATRPAFPKLRAFCDRPEMGASAR